MATKTQPRIHAKPDELVPVFLVRAMFGLVLAVLMIVTFSVMSDRPMESTPPEAAILAERLIYLEGDMSGAARVYDGGNRAVIAEFSSEKGGFIAGVQRVIDRERAKINADMGAPVLLQLREGNRLSLTDPVTGWSAELMGFGATNSRTFARLLD